MKEAKEVIPVMGPIICPVYPDKPDKTKEEVEVIAGASTQDAPVSLNDDETSEVSK